MSSNPYESPLEAAVVGGPPSEDESIRMYYLSHERSVRSLGGLFILGGALGVFAAMTLLAIPEVSVLYRVVLVSFIGGLSFLQVIIGLAMRQLKPWSRIAGTILTIPGLLALPLGTLISAYFLYLLLSQKGEAIFTEEYQRVREATPELNKRLRTSLIVKVLLGILIVLLLMGLLGLVISIMFPDF